MTFLWPGMLYALLAVPAAVFLYVRAQRRRRQAAAAFARFGSRSPYGQGLGAQRHIAPVLFLTALAILLVALARPRAEVRLPRVEGTVILLFDVSGSMAAEDVQPSRMEAAKKSAVEFIQSQPETVQIGIVSFSEGGFTVVQPTNDTNALLAAVERLSPQNGTSLGQGILVALNTIAIHNGLAPVDEEGSLTTGGQKTGAAGNPADGTGAAEAGSGEQGSTRRVPPEQELIDKLPKGHYPSSVIVVLSDGENNQSIDPALAAEAAAEHGVRIDSLGFGTTAGTVLKLDGFSVHTALNEQVLQQIASTAGGKYYYTVGEQDPRDVYANLSPSLVIRPETTEITFVLTGVSILLFAFGAALSILRFNRFP